MLREVNDLTRDIVEALVRRGVPEEEARVGAALCCDAELRGHTSHGVRLLRNVLVEYANGAERRRPIVVADESAVSAKIDGGFHLSWYVHARAAELATEKALTAGIAVVSVRNAGVSGALGSLAERISARGLYALIANSTPVTVVAPGSSTPILGTNPVAIAVPRANGEPLVLDMATSSIAFNEILRRRASGEDLPDGVATDGRGELTRDAGEAVHPTTGRGRILPFGGHRGFGLSLMIELLVSAGVTGRVGEQKRGPVVLEPSDFSGLYVAVRPDVIGDAEDAMAATERLLAELGEQEVRLPGEHSRRERARHLADGVVELDGIAESVLSAALKPDA